MKKSVFVTLLRFTAPAVLGALGTYLATALPEVYAAVCLR